MGFHRHRRVFVWSTRRFQLIADRLGFTLAYRRLLGVEEQELFYHPHIIGYRKTLSGWRFIHR